MNKIVKFVLLPVVGLVVLVMAVAAYIAATFDPNAYKPQIVEAVKNQTQRALKLDGDIKMSFFPSIGATLGKVSLSERGSDREFAAMDDFRTSLKLWPLLSKQAIVDSIEIKNLRANIVRYKDGRTNFDDLTGRDKPPREGASPVAIDIDHVLIENASLTYTDLGEGTKYAFSKLNLKTGRIATGVPTKIELSVTIQGDKPRTNLEASLKTTLTYDLDKQHYALQGLDLAAKGVAAGFSNLNATARGDIDARPASKEFIISKLALNATGKQDSGDLIFKAELPQLNVTKDKVSGQKMALDAVLTAGKSKMTAKVDIPAIEGNARAFKAGEFTANLEMQQPDGAGVKARLSSPLAGSVDAERIELTKLVAGISINSAKLPKNPIDATLNGAAQIDIARENANLTFATKIDDSNINGRAGLAKFFPPAYTFDINIDQLDADRYLPKPDAKKQPEQPFDLSALKNLNATGSIRIGTLKISNVKASNVRLDVKAANSRLEVNPLAANLYQGSLNGAFSVQAAATPVIAIKQTLSGVSVGPLLRDAADFDTLEGKGNISVDVNGQGSTMTALKKALNGSAAIKLTDGAIKGIDIAGTVRNAKARLGVLKGEQTQAANKAEKTDFSELSGTFQIRNGVAHNNDLNGKSPLLRLGGDGDIDIGSENLNYLVKATIVATLAGQGGQALSELKGVTVPVRLTGPFTSPQYKIDFAGVAASAAQAAIEGRKEEIKAKVQDKIQEQVRDRLKGIFGR